MQDKAYESKDLKNSGLKAYDICETPTVQERYKDPPHIPIEIAGPPNGQTFE